MGVNAAPPRALDRKGQRSRRLIFVQMFSTGGSIGAGYFAGRCVSVMKERERERGEKETGRVKVCRGRGRSFSSLLSSLLLSSLSTSHAPDALASWVIAGEKDRFVVSSSLPGGKLALPGKHPSGTSPWSLARFTRVKMCPFTRSDFTYSGGVGSRASNTKLSLLLGHERDKIGKLYY